MDIPRDNKAFLAWASKLTLAELEEIEIELSRRITSVELQLDDTAYIRHNAEWAQKAKVALKYDQWRLDSTRKLIRRRMSFHTRFVDAARDLLDEDTFGILSKEASR